MKKSFQTFITEEEEPQFTGIDEFGERVVSELPVNVFTPECTLEDIKAVLFFEDEEEKELFFQNNKLITVTMTF